MSDAGVRELERLSRLAAMIEDASRLSDDLGLSIDFSEAIGQSRYAVADAAIKEFGDA